MRTPIGNQGEIRIDRIDEVPNVATEPFTERNAKGWIISHSEQGHHHLLERADQILQRTDAPTGATILYAIVKEPTRLFQDAAVPHEPLMLNDPGIYEFRIKREFDPFAEEVRRVAD